MTKLSIIIPCYNEENTLDNCVNKVLEIADTQLSLEIIIVDDGSTDKSFEIAKFLEQKHSEIKVLRHENNCGKGSSISTGVKFATGDYIAIQDADLEYDPFDLKRLIEALVNNNADVIIGSRFLSSGIHRVLYFWHYFANKLLTLLSNTFSDLNLTDMETCYKVFRSDIIKNIKIEEKRFGFEPEIIAKISHKKYRIYEMGISYHGRSYEEGKKIGFKDALRAFYCVFHYNAYKLPIPIQLIIYYFIGFAAAIVNFALFSILYSIGTCESVSILAAFFTAAIVNYILCILFLFRHKAKWNATQEIFIYFLVVGCLSLLDLEMTKLFLSMNNSPHFSKILATVIVFVFNFLGRKYFVFPNSSLK